jgi:hypothetical protein
MSLPMRKIGECLNCGEPRELAAKGLCFTCYRRHERAMSRGPVDRHVGAIRKEQQKIYAAYSSVMIGLGKLGVSKEDLELVIEVIRPYLVPIAEQLRSSGMVTGSGGEEPPPEQESSSPVNSERDVLLFTVHKDFDEEDEKDGCAMTINFKLEQNPGEETRYVYRDSGVEVVIYFGRPPLKPRGVWVYAHIAGNVIIFLVRPMDHFDATELAAVAENFQLEITNQG